MNRLNSKQMINEPFLEQKGNKFLNVTQIYPYNYFESEKYAVKLRQAKDRLNLDGKIKNIVFNVREQLRVRQSSPSVSRAKPKSTKEKLKKTCKPKRQLSAIQETPTESDNAIDNVISKDINSPYIKDLSSDQHKELFDKSPAASAHFLSYKSHKKMLIAQQRKTELENIIKEHKLLMEDRRSLQRDIFAMRHFLDDLQHRINRSIQQLQNKKTICESHRLLNCKI